MMHRILWVVGLCVSMLGCGSGAENDLTLEKLAVQPDNYSGYWSKSITIDVLANDEAAPVSTIEIVQAPVVGSAEVHDGKVLYYAPEQEVDVSFSYRVLAEGKASSPATVSVELKNGIKDVVLANTDLVEGLASDVQITLYLPLTSSDQIDVQLSREQSPSEQIDVIEAEGEQSILWRYIPSGDAPSVSYLAAKSDKLIFSLNEEQRTVSYQYWSTPLPSELYNTIREDWYTSEQAGRMQEGRNLYMNWTSFPAWEIPENPSWDEDPFSNNTWLLYYHSLAWLHAYEYLYDLEQNQDYRKKIKTIIFDYLAKSPQSNPASYMSWNDHAVALRVDVISYFYQQFLKQVLTEEERHWFQLKMQEHAVELRGLLDLDKYYAHNHSMFHSVSLLNLALILPEVFASTDIADAAQQRINTLFSTMVVPETGFSKEQATSYHFVAMELFLTASQFLERTTRNTEAAIKQRLNLMVDAAAHLTYRDGGAPAMGDTPFDRDVLKERLKRIVEAGQLESSYYDFIHGDDTGKPLERAYLEKTEGIVILRPNSGKRSDPEQFALLDFGPPKISHGHHDAGHVTYALDGAEILVDPGGPYLYQGREREYFDTKLSHNVPIVNQAIRIENRGNIYGAECSQQACWSLGRLDETDYSHVRFIFAPKSADVNLVIFDAIRTNSPNATDEIVLQWHMAPKVSEVSCKQVNSKQDECLVIHERAGEFFIHSKANHSVHRSYFEGFDDGRNQHGWVQPKFGTRTPAPMLRYSAESSNLAVLTTFKSRDEESTVVELSDGFELRLPQYRIVLSSLWSETPIVSVVESQ